LYLYVFDLAFANHAISALSYVSVFGRGREVALYNALIGISWAVGAVVGPIIGGAFSDSAATWRWVSYVLRVRARLNRLIVWLGLLYQPSSHGYIRSRLYLPLSIPHIHAERIFL
jgi:MFS family permease